jgi:hypothetical protein
MYQERNINEPMHQSVIPFHPQFFLFTTVQMLESVISGFNVWHYSEITCHLHVSAVFAYVKQPATQNLQFSDVEICLTASFKPIFRTQSVGVFISHIGTHIRKYIVSHNSVDVYY